MDKGPLVDETKCSARLDVANGLLPREIELALLALMLGMKVCRLVFLVEHSHDDSEEHGDDWHVLESSVVRSSTLPGSGGDRIFPCNSIGGSAS